MMKKSWLDKMHDMLLKEPRDKDQLLKIIQEAQTHDVIDADALVMIEGVLTLADLQVRDVMIPRTQMICLHEEQPLEEIIQVVTETGHSRFPVTDEEQETVLGIIHSKDLLSHFVKKDQEEAFNIKDMLRPAMFIPESREVNSLLKDFRINRNHMAIVVDEYGKPSGFITIEDILEEIVGDIEDEFDTDQDAFIKEEGPNSFLVQGLTPIEEFNDYFETKFDDSDFDTIGGLVSNTFSHLPKAGESTELDDKWRATVTEADERRIIQLEINRIFNEETQEA